jgi:hypothetical protein
MQACGLDASVSGWDQIAGCCEHGNETLGSLEGGKFLEQLSDYQLLKKDATSRCQSVKNNTYLEFLISPISLHNTYADVSVVRTVLFSFLCY